MPVKDPSKYKAWEQRRRERLNEAFNNLAQLLPHYDPAKTPAKIDILEKSTEFVKELRLSNSRLLSSQAEKDEKCRLIKELQDEVNRLILRVKQLTHLLKRFNITIPVGPEIKSLAGKKKLKLLGKKPILEKDNSVINGNASSAQVPSPSENRTPSIEGNIPPASTESVKKDSPETSNPQGESGKADSQKDDSSKSQTASIIIPLKEVNVTKAGISSITAPPYTPSAGPTTGTNISSPEKGTRITKSTAPSTTTASSTSFITTTAPLASLSSPLKLISSSEPIFTTTTAPLQFPLQTFIIAPCPLTGTATATALPSQNPQIFTTRITLPGPVVQNNAIDSIALQKIPIKSVLKPIPKVIKRRNRKSKQFYKKLREEAAKFNSSGSANPKNETEKESPSSEEVQNKDDRSDKGTEKKVPCSPEKKKPAKLAEQADKNKSEEEAAKPISVITLDEADENLEKKGDDEVTVAKNAEASTSEDLQNKKSLSGEKQNNSLKEAVAEKEAREVSSDNIPVLRIIDSSKESEKESYDVLSRVVVTEDTSAIADKGKEGKAQEVEIACITIEDEEEEEEETEKIAKAVEETIKSLQNESAEVVDRRSSTLNHGEEAEIGKEKAASRKISDLPKETATEKSKNVIPENEVGAARSNSSVLAEERMDVEDNLEIPERVTETISTSNLVPAPAPAEERRREDVYPEKTANSAQNDKASSKLETSKERNVISESDNVEIATIIPPSSTKQTALPVEAIAEIVQEVTPVPARDESIQQMEIDVRQENESAQVESVTDPLPSTSKSKENQLRSPEKPTSSAPSSLNTPHKPVLLDQNETATTTDKISECIARSIDLIDANDSELMDLDEHWDGAGGSPRSCISPTTQIFLNIFPLLPRDNSASETHQSQPHSSQSQQQTHQLLSNQGAISSQKSVSTSRSSFFIDAMLPEDPSSQQPSSPFSLSNNYYWTPTVSACGFDNTFDYRPPSSHQILPSNSGAMSSLFSNLPVAISATPSVTSSSNSKITTLTPTKPAEPTSSTASSSSPLKASSGEASSSLSTTVTPRPNKSSKSTSTPSSSSTATTSTSKSSLILDFPNFSKSSQKSASSTATATTSTPSTTTTVTWTLTAPSQSSCLTQSSSQITQFPSSSTCSLFDALAPIDASFFRPLMTALETNDFRGLEFPGGNVLPPPPPLPPIVPPSAKSLFQTKNSNPTLNLNTTSATGDHQYEGLSFIFDTNNVPTSTTESNKKQKQQASTSSSATSSSRNPKHNQEPPTSEPASKPTETKAKSTKSGKQKSDSSKQSRSGKSSRTQPYFIPTSNTVSGDATAKSSANSNHQEAVPQINTPTFQPQQSEPFYFDYPAYSHCSSRKSTSSNNIDFQAQNLFAPSLTSSNNFMHQTPSNQRPSNAPITSESQNVDSSSSNTFSAVPIPIQAPAAAQSTQQSKQQASGSSSRSSNRTETKTSSSAKSKEKSPSRAKGGRSTNQPPVQTSQSQAAPTQPQSQSSSSSNRITEPPHPSHQPYLNITHQKSQTKSHNQCLTNPLQQSVPHDINFHHQHHQHHHHHQETFQLFPDFSSSSQHQGNQHHQEQYSQNNYPAQITHPHQHSQHHHQPYFLPDISPSFDTLCQAHQPVHARNPPLSSVHVPSSHSNQIAQTNTPSSAGSNHSSSTGKNIHNAGTGTTNNQTHNNAPNCNQRAQDQQSFSNQPTTSQRRQYSGNHSQSSNHPSENISYCQPQHQQYHHPVLNPTNHHPSRPSHQRQQDQTAVHHQSDQTPVRRQQDHNLVQHHQPPPQQQNVQAPMQTNHKQQQQQHQQLSSQRAPAPSSSSNKAKHQSQAEQTQGHSQQMPPPPSIPFQPHTHITQQTQPQHTQQVQVHHQNPPSQPPSQLQLKPQSHQQTNRTSSSRTVNWMTDSGYRASTSRAAPTTPVAHPTPPKLQQQQQPQRQQNNPFSVSKLVGSTSAKSHPTNPAPTSASRHTAGTTTSSSTSKQKSKTNSQLVIPENVSHPPPPPPSHPSQSQNQSNYCAEALIRKEPIDNDWSEFNFPGYNHHHHQHHPSHQHQQQTSSSALTLGEFSNYQNQYHYNPNGGTAGPNPPSQFPHTENAQVQHFHHHHHPPSQHSHNPTPTYHSSQTHHGSSDQRHNMHYPNSLHLQSTQLHPQGSQHHQYQSQGHGHSSHHHHHHHPSSSTSSVSNFNLSSIFPEFNDKRNGSGNQNQGQTNPNTGAAGGLGAVSASSSSSSRTTGGGSTSGDNICNFQQHPGFANPNSGNNMHQ